MPINTLRVHMENVLVKSVGSKVLWVESRVQMTGEYFPPIQFHGKIVEVEIGGGAIYRPFGEFLRAKSYCHFSNIYCIYSWIREQQPVWSSRPTTTTGVLLTPCHDEFHGPRSDYVRQVALVTTTTTTSCGSKADFAEGEPNIFRYATGYFCLGA
ncbi:uncharacterized protein TNCV_450001 [Trichonephila clavipes]|nr:uncharacterized protein TNCV_450001 [Trichonephila clavipes]